MLSAKQVTGGGIGFLGPHILVFFVGLLVQRFQEQLICFIVINSVNNGHIVELPHQVAPVCLLLLLVVRFHDSSVKRERLFVVADLR